MKNKLVAPVVKWVGGKRQLLSEIEPLFPKRDMSSTDFLIRQLYYPYRLWMNRVSK